MGAVCCLVSPWNTPASYVSIHRKTRDRAEVREHNEDARKHRGVCLPAPYFHIIEPSDLFEGIDSNKDRPSESVNFVDVEA